jgi:hypothetical protein
MSKYSGSPYKGPRSTSQMGQAHPFSSHPCLFGIDVAVVTSARYPLEQLRVTQLSMAPLAAGAGAAVAFSHGQRNPSRPLARAPRASASFHCCGVLAAGTPTAVLSSLLAFVLSALARNSFLSTFLCNIWL